MNKENRLQRILLFLLFMVSGVLFSVCFYPKKSFGIEPDAALFQLTPTGDKAQTGTALPLPDEKTPPPPSWFIILPRLFLALILVVGAIFLTVFGLRLIWEKKGWSSLSEDEKSVKLLGTTFLAPKKVIYLVEVGKKILVLGSGGDELNCLYIVDDKEEIDLLKQTGRNGFPDVIRRVLQKDEARVQEQETINLFEDSKKAVGSYVDKLKEITRRKKGNKEGDEK